MRLASTKAGPSLSPPAWRGQLTLSVKFNSPSGKQLDYSNHIFPAWLNGSADSARDCYCATTVKALAASVIAALRTPAVATATDAKDDSARAEVHVSLDAEPERAANAHPAKKCTFRRDPHMRLASAFADPELWCLHCQVKPTKRRVIKTKPSFSAHDSAPGAHPSPGHYSSKRLRERRHPEPAVLINACDTAVKL